MSNPRFEIEKVDFETWTWSLLGEGGEVLALAPQGYETKEEAQVAIAQMQMVAREAQTPEA